MKVFTIYLSDVMSFISDVGRRRLKGRQGTRKILRAKGSHTGLDERAEM